MDLLKLSFFALICYSRCEKSTASKGFCGSKLCLLDSNRLIESRTSNKSVNPCDDFKEFSMGNFIKFRALHDRYDRSGFLFDILVTYREKHRKLLQAPVTSDERRIFKIAKNFFQQCIDPKYIRNQGKHEVADYLSDKTLPLIDGADWWPDLVNTTKNMFDPSWKYEFFTAFRITQCPHPNDPDREIKCFKFSHEFNFLHKIMLKYEDKTRLDFIERLKEVDFMIRVDQALVNASINHLFSFFEQKLELDYPGREGFPMILKISEINDLLIPTSQLKIDWLQFINTFFMDHSKAYSENEEVMIEDWQLFSSIMELLEATPVRILMDVFHLGFLYGFEHSFTVYPLSRIDIYKRGTQKDLQRYEQCLHLLETNYSPVLLSFYAKFYFDDKTLEDAETFIRLAIADVMAELRKDVELDITILDDLTRKLKKIVIVPAVFKELLENSSIDRMYEELELNGDESLLVTTIALKKHAEKLENEPKMRSWYYQANKLSQLSHVKYFPEQDLIFIPADYIQYPYYDRKRPRFYNTATLFTEIVLSINEGLKSYIKSEYSQPYIFDYDSIELGYKNYLKWEKKGNKKDKKLPGFSLDNRQMYWLAFANSYFMKYHTNVPFYQLDALNLQYKHFHVWFKARDDFRDAFGCDELTVDEIKDFKELEQNFNKVFRF